MSVKTNSSFYLKGTLLLSIDTFYFMLDFISRHISKTSHVFRILTLKTLLCMEKFEPARFSEMNTNNGIDLKYLWNHDSEFVNNISLVGLKPY